MGPWNCWAGIVSKCFVQQCTGQCLAPLLTCLTHEEPLRHCTSDPSRDHAGPQPWHLRVTGKQKLCKCCTNNSDMLWLKCDENNGKIGIDITTSKAAIRLLNREWGRIYASSKYWWNLGWMCVKADASGGRRTRIWSEWFPS